MGYSLILFSIQTLGQVHDWGRKEAAAAVVLDQTKQNKTQSSDFRLHTDHTHSATMSDDRAELIRGQYLPTTQPYPIGYFLICIVVLPLHGTNLGHVAKLQEREGFIRESWVKAMEARLVRDELVKCQRHEGVNSLENCRWLSEKYAQMLIENRVRRSVPHGTAID